MIYIHLIYIEVPRFLIRRTTDLNLLEVMNMEYIWIVVLIILGLAMFLKPEILWKIENIFTVKNGEPTDLYLTLMRLAGIFFIGVGIIVFVVSFI